MKLKKIISLLFSLSLVTIPNRFVSSVQADSIHSNQNANIVQWSEKKDISKFKKWTITFKTPVDINFLCNYGLITVTDSQGNLINTKVSRGNDEKCIYVEPPQNGYKEGEIYYLNIPTAVRFRDESKSIKRPIQMKFMTTDIGTIDIDENSPISMGNNDLAFNLIKELINKDKNENMIISPLSISIILAMTQNGSDKETKQEMINCIGLKNVNDKDINLQYYSLLDYYNSLKQTNIKVANSIWTDKNIDINNDFKNITKKYYETQVNSEDFSNPDTINKINQWVDQKTNGQIKKIINNLNKEDIAILINSVYFKGRWKEEFSSYSTKKEEFTLSNGEKINVDNMKKETSLNYLKGDNFQAVSLDYYDGIKMDIFLPNKGINIDKFIQGMDRDNHDKWIKSFNNTEVILQIPKFKMEYNADLKDTLETLGMKQAFDASKANFEKFANNTDKNPMYIGKIEHKACISVDEKGTEAAAITAEILCGSSAPSEKPKPIEFKVDRPFFFAIRDTKTGTILFMGKVENPSIK